MGEAAKAERLISGDAPIWAIDVGNQRVKIGVYIEGRLAHHEVWAHSEPLQFPLLLGFGTPRGIALSTVNGPASGRITAALEKMGLMVDLTLASDGTVFDLGLLLSGVETPRTTGVDRLLSAIGARIHRPGRDVIVVDCGTAITVNLTTADGTFQGGAIMPGLRLLSQSLNRGTAALPDTELTSIPKAPGKSTRDAILAGVAFAATGGIDRAVDEMLSSADNPALLITGGNARLLQKGLRHPFETMPDLVLDGLVRAYGRIIDGG